MSKIIAVVVLAGFYSTSVLAADLAGKSRAWLDQSGVFLAQLKPGTPSKPSKTKQVNEEDYFKGAPLAYDSNLFFGLGADYFDSFGTQLRYAVRVAKEGFIPDVNDAFYVEGGFGMTFYGENRVTREDVLGFNFVGTGRWDFQLDPTWTLFANLGFGYNAISGTDQDFVEGGGLFPALGAGAMYNFNERLAIRGDLSYQFLGAGVLYRF